MIQNNLDPDVAERPDELIVYGGTGRAASEKGQPSSSPAVETATEFDIRPHSRIGPARAPLRDRHGRRTMGHPAPDPPGARPSRRSFQPNPSFRHTHDLFSCARPNEWCTLTTEEEDKRELRVSSNKRNVPITIHIYSVQSVDDRAGCWLVGQATKGARWMPWR